MLARLAATPDVLVHNFDAVRDAVLLLDWSATAYREASFLDDRILAPDMRGGWVRRERVAQALATVSCARPLHFVFHTGHVGSTLISRLLESSPSVLALREPLSLRTLADLHDVEHLPEALLSPAMVTDLQQQLLRAWSRGYGSTAAVILKATSSAGRIASALLDADPNARALYVNLRPEPFLATLLAGANSLLDLRGHGPARIRRLNARLTRPVSPLYALSPGQLAALAWAVETSAQHEALARHAQRVLPIDFDAFLRDVPAALATARAHLGLGDLAQVDLQAIESELQRYSKAPDQPYSPAIRAQRLADARRQYADEIGRGLAWLESVARTEPAIAGLLGSVGSA
jgi:hypothetical protein